MLDARRARRHTPPAVRSGEDGMISIISLFAVLGLLLLFGLFANAGKTATRKLEVQNGADAAAHAASLEMARAMNSFTTANHLMGELTALAILHHGFGGDELDEGRKPKRNGSWYGTPGREGGDLRALIGMAWNLADKFCTTVPAFLKPLKQAYDRVNPNSSPQVPITGGAIGDSHSRLKQVLTWAYCAHAVGGLLWLIADVVQVIPIIGTILSTIFKIIAGIIMGACLVFEGKCLEEMILLEGMKLMAEGLLYTTKIPLMGKSGVPGIISAIGNPSASYTTAVFAQTPYQMKKAVDAVSTENKVTGETYPPFVAKEAAAVAEAAAAAAGKDLNVPVAGMPVHRDQSKPPAENPPQTDPSKQKANTLPIPPVLGDNAYVFDHAAFTSKLKSNSAQLKEWRQSQLVRATSPWVQYWRVPLLQFGEDALLLARFKCFYWDRTDEYTLSLTARLHLGKTSATGSGNALFGVRPAVIKDWKPTGTPQKGKEEWTKSSGTERADELFSTVAFATRPAQQITSVRIYRQPNPGGLSAYAQGIVYNANSQQTTWPATVQPRIGWDTLNWINDVQEFPGARPTDDTYPVPSGVVEPRVRVNWQAKLVPVSRLHEPAFLAAAAIGTYGPAVQRVSPLFFPADLSLTKTH